MGANVLSLLWKLCAPRTAGRIGAPPACEQELVSLITPTRNRTRFLHALYSLLARQDWSNFEWLIADDSTIPETTPPWLGDSRVKYHYRTGWSSVGEKRNFLIAVSAGSVILHCDDDDYYSPNYVSTQLRLLKTTNADILKLTGFFICDVYTNQLYYWAQREQPDKQFVCRPRMPVHMRTVSPYIAGMAERHKRGFGFSYVYRKCIWKLVRFENVSFAEDLYFMEALMARGAIIHFVDDYEGICVHRIHLDNLSSCFPQYRLPVLAARLLFPDFSPVL